MREDILRVSRLKIDFQTLEGVVKALENVSLSVKKGETFALVGESGCGKSTLGLAIVQTLASNAVIRSGSIILDTIDLMKISEKERRQICGKQVSMIFQDPSTALNPLFTIGAQLSETIKSHISQKSKDELKKLGMQALREVRLPDAEKVYRMYPHELSGGMQQRCVIAIALSTRPRFLIADEPTTMLDVTIQAQILELLLELKKTIGFSILLITHNLGIVAETCDRVGIMYAGTIAEEGGVEQVFESPLHPYTSGLLAAVPKVVEKSLLKDIPGTVPSLIDPPSGCRFHPRCACVMPECRVTPPEPVEFDSGHMVACYRYACAHTKR